MKSSLLFLSLLIVCLHSALALGTVPRDVNGQVKALKQQPDKRVLSIEEKEEIERVCDQLNPYNDKMYRHCVREQIKRAEDEVKLNFE